MSYVIDIIIAMVTGLISGVVVELILEKRNKQRAIYFGMQNFLLGTLSKMGITIPVDLLGWSGKVDDDPNSEWRNSIQTILDYLYPENTEDKEYNEEEKKVMDSIMIAFKGLEEWRKKHRI